MSETDLGDLVLGEVLTGGRASVLEQIGDGLGGNGIGIVTIGHDAIVGMTPPADGDLLRRERFGSLQQPIPGVPGRWYGR